MLIQHGLVPDDASEYRCCIRDVRVEKGRIAEVGAALAPHDGEETFDAVGKLLLPGMVNAHYHSYGNLWKGTAWGEPLEIWSSDTIGLGGRMDDELAVLSAYLGIAEMLRCGVTACVDHVPHENRVDAVCGAYRATGFRAAVAPMISDIGDDRALCGMQPKGELPQDIPQRMRERYDEWMRAWHDPNGTIQLLCALNAPQRASERALAAAADIAKKHTLGVHTHLLETRWQAESAALEKRDPVRLLDEYGLLTERTGLAHGVFLNESQKERIAAAGSTIVHIPTGNLFLGSGRADILAYRKHGIAIALGSDGSNCGTGQNLLSVLRAEVLLSRLTEPDYTRWMRIGDAWKTATENGAAVCGFPVGAIRPGMRADLVLAELSDLAYVPAIDLLPQSIFLADRLDVTDVWIEGKPVLQNRRLVCMDEDALKKEILARAPRLKEEGRRALQAAKADKQPFEIAYRKRMGRKEE